MTLYVMIIFAYIFFAGILIGAILGIKICEKKHKIPAEKRFYIFND